MKFQMKERRRRGPWVFLLLILSLLLVGCTPEPIIIERNITVERIVYNNTIEYINNTIIEPCNQTEQDNHSVSRLELIRRLKKYEKVQDQFVNQSSCMLDLNNTEYKLKERELELCDNWNSSWC